MLKPSLILGPAFVEAVPISSPFLFYFPHSSKETGTHFTAGQTEKVLHGYQKAIVWTFRFRHC